MRCSTIFNLSIILIMNVQSFYAHFLLKVQINIGNSTTLVLAEPTLLRSQLQKHRRPCALARSHTCTHTRARTDTHTHTSTSVCTTLLQ